MSRLVAGASGRWPRRRGSLSRRELGALLACVVAGCSLWAATPGLALTVRGHVLGGTLGSEGTGAGGVREPLAVAVSSVGSTAGDVYVLDGGNARVDVFSSSGGFVEAWGWGVADGKDKYERCSTECRPGLSGPGKFGWSAGSAQIAVDDSGVAGDEAAGDVFVEVQTREEDEAVERFSPTGERVETVDHVLVKEAGEKHRSEMEEEELDEIEGLAVGADGTVWVYDEEAVYGLDGADLKAPTEKKAEATLTGQPGDGLAVDGSGVFYMAQQLETGFGRTVNVISKQVAKAGDPGVLESLTEELDGASNTLSATGVAADESSGRPHSGDVYVDEGASVARFDAHGRLLERFGEGDLQAGAGVALDQATGSVFVADTLGDDVLVFSEEGARAPRVDGVSAQDVSAASARVDAQVDPEGEASSFWVEYGTPHVSCVAEPSACTRLASEALAEGPDGGFGDVGVSVLLGGEGSPALAPDTLYHYRVVAHSPLSEGGPLEEREGSFRTLPGEGPFTADGRVWELVSQGNQGGASVEAPRKEGAAVQAAANGNALTYVTNAPVGNPEGSRSIEVTQMLSTRGEHGWGSTDIVTPNEHGTGIVVGFAPEYRQFSTNLALSMVQPFPGGGGPLAEPPLSPPITAGEEGHQEKTIYLRDDQPIATAASSEPFSQAGIYDQAKSNGETLGNPGYLALVSGADTKPDAGFGGNEDLDALAGTPDLTHVVFNSKVPLLEGLSVKNNLYEWAEGQLKLVSMLPGTPEVPALYATLGGEQGRNLRHAISKDGSLVFWSTGGDLFARDMESGKSVALNEVQPEAEGTGIVDAEFQTASSDGSRVFFTDEQRLTKGSGAGPGRADLYVCQITITAGVPSCALKDLTPAYPEGGEPAAVQGMVLGASEDGSYVYFVANGVLSKTAEEEGAQPGQCRSETRPAALCNLYVDHLDAGSGEWEGARLVAELSNEDRPGWEPRIEGDLGEVSAAVSPDGEYLAFMSQRAKALVGYDNEDAASAYPGERLDQEVFLYHAPAGTLSCVSCDPSGGRPHGVWDPEGEGSGPEGSGLLVDRTKTWEGHWLAGSIPSSTKIDFQHANYQPRFLSDSGRLFFQSPEGLVPADVNGKEDVYEYEPQGVPAGAHECTSSSATFEVSVEGCVGLISSGSSDRESAFLDASETGGEGEHGLLDEGGSDVFFISAQPLVPEASGTAFQVYDAHECSAAFSACNYPQSGGKPQDCENTAACHPYTAATPGPDGVISTATSGPSGNVLAKSETLPSKTSKPKPKPLTLAQKLSKALQACRSRYRHSRTKRLGCERKARATYKPHAAKKTAKPRAKGRA